MSLDFQASRANLETSDQQGATHLDLKVSLASVETRAYPANPGWTESWGASGTLVWTGRAEERELRARLARMGSQERLGLRAPRESPALRGSKEKRVYQDSQAMTALMAFQEARGFVETKESLGNQVGLDREEK